MQYKITAIRRKQMPRNDGGTWTKTEVKTDRTGDRILEFGFGHSKSVKDNAKVGDMVDGYVERKPWTGRDGQTRYNEVLNGITAKYVHSLLLKAHPHIEEIPTGATEIPKVDPSDESWKNGTGAPTSNSSDDGFGSDGFEDDSEPGF